MSNEKIMILKMLEEKKITADEAARLLAATKESNEPPFRNEPNRGARTSFETENKNRQYQKDTFKTRNYGEGNTTGKNQTTQNIDDFARDISKKFEALAKEMEPKIQKVAEIVVEKTSLAADKLSKSLQQNNTETRTRRPSPTTSTTSNSYSDKKRFGLEEKVFEIKIDNFDNQLNLKSINGDILIKGYNGDKLSGKVFYKSKGANKDISFTRLGNKYLLNYSEEDFNSVCIDIFVPEKMFNNIIIDGKNGEVNISTLSCEYFIVRNQEGNTFLNDISADNIDINCNVNNLTIKNIKGKTGKIENYNGEISVFNLDVEKLKIDIFNSNITVNMEDYVAFEEYLWEVESSNGRIYFNLPNTKELGYYLNARTSLSDVRVTMIGLNYLANSNNFVEARSINYDNFNKHILLRLETSNGPVVIN